MKSVLKQLIPSPLEIGREAIIVMAGVTIAALVINYFKPWQKAVQDASITVKDQSGNVLW